jgi:flagellar biosynthesis protein FlhA
MTELSDEFRAEANRKLLDELVPDKVPMDTLHAVLRLLLEERVSIRNMPLILETIAEARQHISQPEMICEHVRQRLGFQLVGEMKREDGTIPLIQLAPEWEETFSTYQIDAHGGAVDIALPPDKFNQLAEGLTDRLNTTTEQGVFAAVVTSTRRRRYLRTILKSRGIMNPVLSFEEIGLEARPALVGMVPA